MDLSTALFYKLLALAGDTLAYLSQFSALQIGVAVLCVIVTGALYYLLFVPLDRRMKLYDVAYVPGVGQSRMSRKELANWVMNKKKEFESDYHLPVYPNGWFYIISSRDLKVGQIVNADYLGLSLAVFRDEKGEVHAVDAYCPHMGANFAVGGRVFGDCIECPFHGWRFRGHDGKCTSVPYAEKVPSVAQVKSYTVLERNQCIYLWYHAEGEEPYWQPPIIDELHNGAYSFGAFSEHAVNCHIEEIPENGADVGHLNIVHKENVLTGHDLRTKHSKLFEFAFHDFHDVTWKAFEEPSKHVAEMNALSSVYVEFLGRRMRLVTVRVKVSQIGPGIVYLDFGKAIMLHHVTPMGPHLQHVRHEVHSSFPTIISKGLLYFESLQFERDIMIWNSKKPIRKPVLSRSKEDELIARHRRWYSQFYSENSPRLKMRNDTLEW